MVNNKQNLKWTKKLSEQLNSPSRITAIALCAIAAALVAVVSFRTASPTAQDLSIANPLTIVADDDQEFLASNDGGGDDEVNVIRILSKQKNAQKKRINDLAEQLEATKALVQKMKTQLMIADGTREQKLKQRASELESQAKDSETLANNYRQEIRKRDAIIDDHRKEFDSIAKLLGQTNEEAMEQLAETRTLLNEERERTKMLNAKIAALAAEENGKLNAATAQFNQTLVAMEQMGNELGITRDQLYSVEEANSQLLDKVASLQNTLNAERNKTLRDLQTDNGGLNEQLSALLATNAMLHEQISETVEANMALEEQLMTVATREFPQRGEPLAYLHDGARSSPQTEALEAQILQLEQANAKQLQLIDNLTLQITASEAKALTYADKLHAAKPAKADNSAAVIEALEEELSSYRESLREAKERLLALSEESASNEDKKGVIVQELNLALRDLREENQEISSDNQKTRKELAQARMALDEMEFLKDELTLYREKLAAAENAPGMTELKKELAEASNAIVQERRRAELFEHEMMAAKRLLETYQEEMAGMEMEEGNSTLSQIRQAKYGTNLNKLKAKIAHLTTRLAQEMNKTNAVEDRLDLLQSQYTELAKNHEELNNKLFAVTGEPSSEELDQLQDAVEALTKELMAERENGRRVRKQLELAQNQPKATSNSDVDGELRQYKIAISSLQNEFNLLANEYADLEAANNVLASNYQKTVDEFRDLLEEEQAKTRMLINDFELIQSHYQSAVAEETGH